MGVVAVILGGIELVTELVTATGRLRRAERALERDRGPQPPAPPRPLGHSGYPEALAYLRGRDDAAAQREQQERAHEAADRFAKDAASTDEGEAEKPRGEGETP